MEKKFIGVKALVADAEEKYFAEIKTRAVDFDGIVICGVERWARSLNKFLQRRQLKVTAFCVNDESVNESLLDGLPVFSLNTIASSDKKILYLIASQNESQSEWEQAIAAKGIEDIADFPAIFRKLKHKVVLNELRRQAAVEITPLIGCPINCRYCPQSQLIKNYKGSREMRIADFKRYLNKIPQEVTIVFSGFVEPFLAIDGLEMMEYAASQGRKIHLYTTLVGLTKEKFERLKKIHFESVALHLPDNRGCADIPQTAEYYELLETVMAEKNFVKKASSQCEPAKRAFDIVKDKVPVSWKMCNRAGLLVQEGLITREPLNKLDGMIYCNFNLDLTSSVLLPNGDMVLCCMDFGLKHILGNLNVESYDEIINGEVRKKILEGMSKGDVRNTLCQCCTEAYVLKS